MRISTRPRRQYSFEVVVPYVLIHLACLGIVWTDISGAAISTCVASYVIRIVAVGASYHRYFAHRSFKTTRSMQFVLGLLGSLGMQGGPLWWANTHRLHHRFADTVDDIHSPHYQGFLYAHSGWFADRAYRRTDLGAVLDLARFPELVWLDRWYLVMPAILAAAMFAVFGWAGVVWGVCVSSVLIWHTTHCIQSFGHRYGGSRRWPTRDDSRNHWVIAVLTLGEWHNNHHYCPASARQGFAWWEVDIVYALLRALSWTGLIWDLRTAPSSDLNSRLPPRARLFA
jgi:stearoyl-CoA desaturase (Delta-9 desaturase)